MTHVNINGQIFELTPNGKYCTKTIQAAQAAMLAAGIESAPELDSDGDETGDSLPDEIPVEALALAAVLGCSPLNCGYDGCGSCVVWSSDEEPGEYRVLGEIDREDAISEALDSYCEECIIEQARYEARQAGGSLESLVDTLLDHFDHNDWKKAILDSSGNDYGEWLAIYDGKEREAVIDGTYYYVYRVN